MEKMFVYSETVESSVVDGSSMSDPERVQTTAGIVSYQAKVYRASLEQGISSRHVGRPVVAPSRTFLNIRGSAQSNSLSAHKLTHG